LSKESLIVDVEVHGKGPTEITNLLHRKIGQPIKPDVTELSELWGADSYDLEGVDIFKESSLYEKTLILEDCARGRLEEAFHIEKSGMAFTSKMTLLADTLEERKLYCQFSADEANHLEAITNFLPNVSDNYKNNPFIGLLADVINTGSRRPLIFIIQVLLEGWGIDHYQGMFNTCRFITLGEVLSKIIKDEAGHHGSGLMLFNENELTSNEFNYIVDTLRNFFQMVQVGSVGVLSSIEKIKGHLSNSQKIGLLHQLESRENAQRKINVLKKLMHKAESNKIIEALEKANSFRAFDYQTVVQV
jgi:rubrerythrin